MTDDKTTPFAFSVFCYVIDRPKWIIGCCLTALIVAMFYVPQLSKDTRSDAFLSEDNPALVYRAKVKEQFGLSDPVIVAIEDRSTTGVFNPDTLALVQRLSDKLSALPNVNASKTLSLATQKNISSTDEGIDIQPFLSPAPVRQTQADLIRHAVDDFPLLMGSIVSEDHYVTLIVLELIDEFDQESSYDRILALVESTPHNDSTRVHVAGEGALAGFLGSYIETDAKRLNPIAWLVISLIIYLAYRAFTPVLMANVIIAASVLLTLAAMAAANVPFYMITSALPVILIGISVADSIHIYNHYFTLQTQNPEREIRQLTVDTMMDMWRPVTLTTITTMAGFMGLYFAAYMPPFKYFGLFASLGVFVAWLYSMVFLPAAIVLSKPKARSRFLNSDESFGADFLGNQFWRIGSTIIENPRAVLLGFLTIFALGVYAAAHLKIDENPINIFDTREPIYIADQLINRHLDGSNALDIVVETPVAEGFFDPHNLKKIEALQTYAASLPRVGGSTSIADYLKQINKALNEGKSEYYALPKDSDLIAQYFLLYSTLADPTDFEEEIDYNYQTANIRINLNSGNYQDFKIVVESLQAYIDSEFNDDNIKATLSGRVSLNYHWIKDLGRSHFAGLILALGLVAIVSALLFKSWLAGIFTLIPVIASVLFVYAAMVSSGMTLGVGTSMFAAVTIGLGVDFAIHTLDRLRSLLNNENTENELIAYQVFYQTTGRALLFNFFAIALGFGVLIVSKVASLNNFGGMLVVAVTSSFVGSLTILPVLVRTLRPNFVIRPSKDHLYGNPSSLPTFLGAIFLGFVLATLFAPTTANAQTSMTAEQLVTNVNTAQEGEHLTREIAMHMTDRHGKQRSRETISYRKNFESERKTVLFFLEPANVRDTGFLIWNYTDPAKMDDQWLYLPALRKVRRVSAAKRGDYFLGTDFTYEDMKLDGKLEPLDYSYTLKGEETVSDISTYVLDGLPRTQDIADELGYSRTISWIDPISWKVIKAEFYGSKGALLKTLTASDIRQVNGYWTRHALTMQNHQSGHTTDFVLSEVDYLTPIPNRRFSSQALARGH